MLTFNIHNGMNPYGKYNLEQTIEFIGKVKPDLAGLQEVSRFWSQKTNYQDIPIINSWAEILPGNLESRSCLAVQVQTGGSRVNFLTTHLGLSNSERLAQADKVVSFGSKLGEPLIITGDFNQGPNSPEK